MKTKERISVTMTKFHIESMNEFIEAGFHLSRGEVILAALLNYYRLFGMLPPMEEVEG